MHLKRGSFMTTISPNAGTLAYNYAPSTPAYPGEGDAANAERQYRRDAIVSAVQDAAYAAVYPSAASIVPAGLNLVAATTGNEAVGKLATVAGGASAVASALQPTRLVPADPGAAGAFLDAEGNAWKAAPDPGTAFNVAGSALGTLASLTQNKPLQVAASAATGVGNTIRAASYGGAAAGATTGVGAGLGILSQFINGGRSKLVNAASLAASTAGSILSKATSLGAGLVSGIPGVVGTLIGGPVGNAVSSIGSIGAGVAMMAANPILGAVGILGGLFGLFGGKGKRVSKLSEQMAADFKGDGTQNDLMTRAPKGKNNDLRIEVEDGVEGESKLRETQTIKLDGWFDSEDQSRMAQTVDVTGDGKDDIVWQDKNSVSVFVNRGDGSFGNDAFAQTQKTASEDSEGLQRFGRLLEALNVSDVGEVGSYTFNMAKRMAGPALRESFDAAGGQDKLGDFDAWATEMVLHENLGDVRVDFKAEGNHSDFGGFANYVSRRLTERGIERPRSLDSALEREIQRGESSLDEMLGSRDGVVKEVAHPRGDTGRSRAAARYVGAPGDMSVEQAASDLKAGGVFGTVARRMAEEPSERVLGEGSAGALDSGVGVSLKTQEMEVSVEEHKPNQLFFWDVNGDSLNDLVFMGDRVAGKRAFLNEGNGVFWNNAIDLQQPTNEDLQQLLMQDPATGTVFMNADFAGDGKQRLQAVLDPYTGQLYQVPRQPQAPVVEELAID
jgi:hypothetical protein